MAKLPQSQHPAVRAINFRAEIGKQIYYRRRQVKLTQREVAERFGVSREMIAAVEQGRTDVNAGDLPRLAAILHVPIDYFFVSIPKSEIGEYEPITEPTWPPREGNFFSYRPSAPVVENHIPVSQELQLQPVLEAIAQSLNRIEARLTAVDENQISETEPRFSRDEI